MINRAIILLVACSFGGLAAPSAYESYIESRGGGVERVEPSPSVLEAATRPSKATNRMRTSGQSVILEADASGHYKTDARLNGLRNAVLIDTGATKVAISAATARQIGIHPGPDDWTIPIQTANGTAKAASAVIDRLEIGPLMVRDVDALILEDGLLGVTLLGMSFLSELSRYSVEDGQLTMVR